MHHINDDYTLFSVLPRQNDCQLPEQHTSKNLIGTALQKPGGTERCSERELLLNPIQERKRDLRLTRRTATRRSLFNRSIGSRIHNPSRSRTTRHSIRYQQRHLRESQQRPFWGSEGVQGVGQLGACRQKTNCRSSEQKNYFQSFWLQSEICTSPCEGHYRAFI